MILWLKNTMLSLFKSSNNKTTKRKSNKLRSTFEERISLKDLSISTLGVKFIKQEEGLILYTYPDQVGVLTIGWGHTTDTLPHVYSGMEVTKEQAEVYLKNDLRFTEELLRPCITFPNLSQNKWDALVSLVFNQGITKFKDSALLRYVNSGIYDTTIISQAFNTFTYSEGKYVWELASRRKREINIYLNGIYKFN